MGRRWLIMILFALPVGCNFMGDSSERNLYSLYRQRIPNSSLVIYDFGFSGSFVTSSDYTGLAILDSTIDFSKERIKALPSTYFAAKPVSSKFEMLNVLYDKNPTTPKDTLLTPVHQFSETIYGIPVQVTEYSQTYGSATSSTGLMAFEFNSLKETHDSLTFYNVSKKFGGKEFPSTTSFVKGNIKVVDSTGGNINYIDIDQVIIKRGDLYKSTKPLELVSNQAIVGMATYRFYPRWVIKATALTDYGIFKRVK